MKDMTFQIEKMKVLRENTVQSAGKPVQVILGLCDVILEMLAEMQGEFMTIAPLPERGSPPDRPIRNPLTLEDRRKEVLAMLQICSNELENKTLFPNEWETEVVLYTDLSKENTIQKNASYLIREILRTLERK